MVEIKSKLSRGSCLERRASKGDSPVLEDDMTCSKRVGLAGLQV